MMQDDNDWAALQRSWQAGQSAPAEPAWLKAAVRREQRRARWEMLAEVLISLGCAVVLASWAGTSRGWTAGILWALVVAAGISRGRGDTVTAWRGQLRRQARLGLLLARLGLVGGPLGLVLGLALGTFGDMSQIDRTLARGLIGPVGLVILALGWCWALHEARRHQRTLRTLAAEDQRDEERA
jgi:hypothetical protein